MPVAPVGWAGREEMRKTVRGSTFSSLVFLAFGLVCLLAKLGGSGVGLCEWCSRKASAGEDGGMVGTEGESLHA